PADRPGAPGRRSGAGGCSPATPRSGTARAALPRPIPRTAPGCRCGGRSCRRRGKLPASRTAS
nr:hypothetical protein [Tanacetum cinerariifolium]